MPKVTIIEPNKAELSKTTLRNIAHVMEKIIETETGTKVKIDLTYKKDDKKK